jgi:hypothetical protein
MLSESRHGARGLVLPSKMNLLASVRWDWPEGRRKDKRGPLSPVGNLRSEILVVQSAQNWHRQRAADSLDGTRDRRVLVQR